jgi:hypothetical protein
MKSQSDAILYINQPTFVHTCHFLRSVWNGIRNKDGNVRQDEEELNNYINVKFAGVFLVQIFYR